MNNATYALKVLTPITYNYASNNLTCMTQQEFKENFITFCKSITGFRPLYYILAAVVLGLIEYIVIIWVIKSPDCIVYYKKFNEYFYIRITRLEIWVQLAVFKFLLLFAACLFIYFGVRSVA